VQCRVLVAEVWQAHDPPHEHVVVGSVLEAVVVAAERGAHYAEHEDVPEIHPRPPGRVVLLPLRDFGFEQSEHLFVDLGRLEDPLQPGKHGREFVAALGGDRHVLDGRLPEHQLVVESLAHADTSARIIGQLTPCDAVSRALRAVRAPADPFIRGAFVAPHPVMLGPGCFSLRH
jgi:hypothetical protein